MVVVQRGTLTIRRWLINTDKRIQVCVFTLKKRVPPDIMLLGAH